MPPRIQITKVLISRTIIDRKDTVKYLVMPDWHVKQVGDVVERVPGAEFNKFVETHVQAYIEGKAPPGAIQSAVMNIADDYLSGRDVVVRAGDYMALQNHFRG